MYCQKTIRGVPYSFGKIVKGAVTFVYFPREINEVNEAWTHRAGHLHMHPLKRNELRSLLQKKGFTNIQKYSDFVKGDNDQADFFTYTANKPALKS